MAETVEVVDGVGDVDVVLRVEELLDAVEVRVALEALVDEDVSDDVELSEGNPDALFVTLPDSLADAELVAESVENSEESADVVVEGEPVSVLDDDNEKNVGSEEVVAKFVRTLTVVVADAADIVIADDADALPEFDPEMDAVFDGEFVCVCNTDNEGRMETDDVTEYVALPVREAVARSDGDPLDDCDAVTETLRDWVSEPLIV